MPPRSTDPYLCPLCQSEMLFEDSDEPKTLARYRCLKCGTQVELGDDPPDEPEDTE